MQLKNPSLYFTTQQTIIALLWTATVWYTQIITAVLMYMPKLPTAVILITASQWQMIPRQCHLKKKAIRALPENMDISIRTMTNGMQGTAESMWSAAIPMLSDQ